MTTLLASPSSNGPSHQLKLYDTYGALFLSVIFSTCLFGITISQSLTYFRRYSNDSFIVRGTALLPARAPINQSFDRASDTLSTALATAGVYRYLISNFSNPLALTRIDE
ncbi:hypothetical protein HGRIS_003449 [Hohenbuehelia grisea]|uniref:Uncharacterized protein n=1 Tax=Hohenbuehelia grisea TaxID=104357 RepID=A0ABR3JGA9_9AGAR